MKVQPIAQAAAGKVVAVFCDAFRDYPVMRYVAGPDEGYEARLARLVDLFVAARCFRGHPLFGVRNGGGELAAAITLTPPGRQPPSGELAAYLDAAWSSLGDGARRRYRRLEEAWSSLDAPEAYWHVNMLGVRRADQGRGLASILLQAACDRAAGQPGCPGIHLTTEDPGNLAFYEERGFQVIGHARAGDGPETWSLARRFG